MRSEYTYEFPSLQKSSLYQRSPSINPWNFPLRFVRLCLLGIAVPCLLISIPLYLRYRVYNHQLYPLAMSDMRMIDNKVSTVWCQKQRIHVNATFNAYLLSKIPDISTEKRPMSMVKELFLEDDTKEYWGFYLLKGTTVTVSTCVRWPGASLIMIRGHKHLHECAYIGDNSSEELEEQIEAIKENIPYKSSEKKPYFESDEKKADQPANNPEYMKRHRSGVEFHSPIHQNNSQNAEIKQSIDNNEVIEVTDIKDMRKILQSLREKTLNYKSKLMKKDNPVHRNSTIALDETKNFKIEKPKNQSSSEETITDMLEQLKKMGNKGSKILEKVNERYKEQKNNSALDIKARHYSKPTVNFEDNIEEQMKRRKRNLILKTTMDLNANDEDNDMALEEGERADGIADLRGTINETSMNDMSNSEFWSSFSSSEEALLNCAGLILSLPLMPHRKCTPDITDKESYRDNTVTYTVPVNGYYFFVFNSENEVQTNFVRVQFDIDKTVYNVSDSISKCVNATGSCAMNLDFWTEEKLVMELPVAQNESLWNEEYVVLSECEPRSAVYGIFVVLVPFFVIFFAFM